MLKEERLIIVKRENFKRKSLSLSLKSLAFALGLTAATSTTSFAMPVKEEETIENHDHEHEYDSIDEVVVKMEENYSNNEEKIYKLIAIKEVQNYSISNYKGSSIVEALNLCGIDSSYNNRKVLAANYGIKNYRGTSAQNILLLNSLKNDNVTSFVKVSDIEKICKDLFGKNAYKVISDLKLPKTSNLTKSEFARIIRSIASYMGVNTTTYNNKLDLVKDVIGDIDLETLNNNDIAWSYYMGYTDLDTNLNYNANNLVSVNELNNWIKSFTSDYNTAINNKNYNANGLIIVPGLDKYQRDNNDLSKINDIRNPQSVIKPSGLDNNYSENKHSDNYSDNKHSNNDPTDDKHEQHKHKYSAWTYHNEDIEVSTCKDCGSKKYQKHNLGSNVQTSYQTNENGTHKIIKVGSCTSCYAIINKETTANCNFNEWNYNELTGKDERDCNDCGYIETRVHEHSEPVNLQYNYYASNEDGTHKLKATYECSKCHETIELYKDVDCSLSAWTYNHATGKDERSCNACGYTETRVHEHDREPSNLTYEKDGPNYDGTHKYKASYTCNTCSSIITLTKDEDCKYDDDAWTKHDGASCKNLCIVCGYEKYKNHNFVVVPNSIIGNATLGKHNVTNKCDDCDYTKQVEENCISNGNRYYYRNGDIITEREDCLLCGEVCVDNAHTHSYGDYTSIDDDQHKKVCDCTYESIEGHSYGEWTLNNNQNTRECSECHNVQTVEVEDICSKYTKEEFPDFTTDDYCYLRVTVCDHCDYREVEQEVGHNYVTIDEGSHYIIQECDRCGHEKEEEILSTSFSLRSPNLEQEEKIEEIIDETIIVEEPIVEEIIEEEKGKILVLK